MQFLDTKYWLISIDTLHAFLFHTIQHNPMSIPSATKQTLKPLDCVKMSQCPRAHSDPQTWLSSATSPKTHES